MFYIYLVPFQIKLSFLQRVMKIFKRSSKGNNFLKIGPNHLLFWGSQNGLVD